MRILESSRSQPEKTLTGRCQQCGCKVEASLSEVKVLVDRDSPAGARYVRCPECSNEYLWVL